MAIVNFNTSRQTLRCLESLRASTRQPQWVCVLDNASGDDDFDALARGITPLPRAELRLFRSTVNLGFAGGNNALIDELMRELQCHVVVLLNNDATAEPAMLERLVDAASNAGEVALVGGRMNRLAAPTEPDSLGISIYASLMPANRLSADDPYLGPTGGCCLITRSLVEKLKEQTGYVFDERFFCYCEDTDLAMRALLLGHRPVYAADAIALHEGQASTGNVDNDFIAYHGLRNLIWMHAKLVPGWLLVKYGVLLAAAHAMTLVRQTLSGRFVVMLAVYRDALRKLPEFWRERKRFAALQGHVDSSELDRLIAPRFYRRGYLGEVIAQLKARRAKRQAPA
ncbi:glycosyltransferase family 2 protein [Usitatibacter palustris]|uniref:Glycosyltransferase 2-like domain-containing protein n=1 Tax=Usitatibacter palustris TaxID=2732487 RepID=A0A6M4HA86_9PROT|nr:glycosyltransferase family 2 protein [Usitatibacter palustris]QJR16530.1 hypothetical protein DSM104440_03365 [Usitatibacter palustris]